MSWPPHGPVDERDDYRDRAFSAKIARAAAHGVVLLGVSRSGKTTLLNRLKESGSAPNDPVISLERGPKATLAKLRETGPRTALLDEGQLLLKWPVSAQRQLIAALEDRPFVLAAWPSLFDPDANEDVLRWLERLRFERLLPLSWTETAAMVRRLQCEPPLPCDDATISALFSATGGHAVLLARLCCFLSDNGVNPLRYPDSSALDRFVDSVTSWNNPFQAMLASLPRAHQSAVQDLARGDRRSLSWLVEHGLACDNPPRYVGSLFTLAWGALPLQAEPVSAGRPKAPSRPTTPTFQWIHVSDIHFGAGDPSRGFDRLAVTRAIRDDARALADRLGSPDRIFVTGDIAQRADPREYEVAYGWLRELAEASSAPMDRVRVVPGNHDVDRGAASQRPTQRAHEAIRESPEELDGDLADSRARAGLAEKLSAYRSFVATKLPEHPPSCPTDIDWTEVLPEVAGRRGKVRIAGLSTVWVSDWLDGRDKRNPDGRSLWPNMVVSRGQLEHTLGQASEGALLLVLSHHPPEWLVPKSAAWFSSALASRAHVHFSGHVHDAQAGSLRRIGRSGASVRYVAGAAHGDSTETYGYAWGGVRWSFADGRWEVGWAPRIYVPELQRIVADRNHYPDLGPDDFGWEPLSVGWAPPDGASR